MKRVLSKVLGKNKIEYMKKQDVRKNGEQNRNFTDDSKK